MHTTIFYYTGTGNSLWVARKLAELLGETELVPIAKHPDGLETVPHGVIGLVFPVHMWGIPAPVLRFVRTLRSGQPDYVFAVAVNGSQVAATLVQLQKILGRNGLTLAAGFEVILPSNYTPFGGPGPQEEQDRRFKLAGEKVLYIADKVKGKASLPVEKGPFWQRMLSATIYKLSFNQVPQMDKQFWVDEKCNHCGICYKVCPANNIALQEGKPVWNHKCEQCFACLQWCPQEAIQFGKNTSQRKRYHHPEVSLKEVILR
ncbi:MAG TPA: EFR1 family ferrodoxin [Anaerolineae bacterium]|nr:EFR1 family ferrodoxin [Anaerolineae bacterium]HQK15140.1 EFR1 family ferrodoxin [Anaerolineae bacterium]